MKQIPCVLENTYYEEVYAGTNTRQKSCTPKAQVTNCKWLVRPYARLDIEYTRSNGLTFTLDLSCSGTNKSRIIDVTITNCMNVHAINQTYGQARRPLNWTSSVNIFLFTTFLDSTLTDYLGVQEVFNRTKNQIL